MDVNPPSSHLGGPYPSQVDQFRMWAVADWSGTFGDHTDSGDSPVWYADAGAGAHHS